MPSYLGMDSILGSSLTRCRRTSPHIRSIRQERGRKSSMIWGETGVNDMHARRQHDASVKDGGQRFYNLASRSGKIGSKAIC